MSKSNNLIDMALCVGVEYMNNSWVLLPHERRHMIDGFCHTKDFKEAKSAINQIRLTDLKRIQEALQYNMNTVKDEVEQQIKELENQDE